MTVGRAFFRQVSGFIWVMFGPRGLRLFVIVVVLTLLATAGCGSNSQPGKKTADTREPPHPHVSVLYRYVHHQEALGPECGDIASGSSNYAVSNIHARGIDCRPARTFVRRIRRLNILTLYDATPCQPVPQPGCAINATGMNCAEGPSYTQTEAVGCFFGDNRHWITWVVFGF